MSRRTAVTLLLVGLLGLASAASAQATPEGRVPAERLFARFVQAQRTHEVVGRVVEEVAFPDDRPRSPDRFTYPVGLSPRLIEQNFAMAITSRERVATRETVVLQLLPRNGLSPSWRFWIDAETGLGLAYEQRSALGEPIASGRYLSVERVRALGEERNLGPAGVDAGVRRAAARLLGAAASPEGFTPIALERTTLGRGGGIPALRLTLWDGLNGLVLLVYPRQRELPERPFLASRSTGEVTLSALGPLPKAALAGWLERLEGSPLSRLDGGRLRRFDLDNPRDRP